ncbi:MAG TPA: ChbG/HpnK family deacetylase, partial [Steroidobacteraceae bacterium]
MRVVPEKRDAEIIQPRAAHRRVWLVADDYGISPAVNAAIRDLAARRRLSATSVMVAAPSFDRSEAARLAALSATTTFAIGLHLTLTAPFRPLSGGFQPP